MSRCRKGPAVAARVEPPAAWAVGEWRRGPAGHSRDHEDVADAPPDETGLAAQADPTGSEDPGESGATDQPS